MRRLGETRAGEMRLTRFLHNEKVTMEEMLDTAFGRTAQRVGGRHVLAIQDTTDMCTAADGTGVVLHPTIAVDAVERALLGVVHAEILKRSGAPRVPRNRRPHHDKDSARWSRGAARAADLLDQGAAHVTVVADREADIYRDFALRPRGVDLLVRASHHRPLRGGGTLADATGDLPEAGRMTIDIPAAPGRRARTAKLTLRHRRVEVLRPRTGEPRAARRAQPAAVPLTVVETHEIDPPPGVTPAHWRLLTTHEVTDVADARRMVEFYRERWTIEQLFRTLKRNGFDAEKLRISTHAPLCKLLTAALIAALTVLQLTRERDGTAKRPLEDAFDPDEQPVLEKLSSSLEGKTERQKNPHPRIPWLSPHGSSPASAAGTATTESPDPSSCSTASSDTTPSSRAGH